MQGQGGFSVLVLDQRRCREKEGGEERVLGDDGDEPGDADDVLRWVLFLLAVSVAVAVFLAVAVVHASR